MTTEELFRAVDSALEKNFEGLEQLLMAVFPQDTKELASRSIEERALTVVVLQLARGLGNVTMAAQTMLLQFKVPLEMQLDLKRKWGNKLEGVNTYMEAVLHNSHHGDEQ